jgi:TonB family protein
MRTIACIAGALILTGCASAGHIGELPAIADGMPSSTLVLVRPSNLIGMANSLYIALDGNDVFSIRSGDNTHFAIPAGQHTIAVKCFGGWSPTWKEDSKGFSAEPDRASYFSVSPSMTCAKIEQVSEVEGKALVANTTYVDSAVASNKDAPAPVSSSQCPVQLRHGIREAVCASQALAPPSAPVDGQVTAAAQASANVPSAIPVSSASSSSTALSAAAAAHAAPAMRSAPVERVKAVTKMVAGKRVTCHVPLASYPHEALPSGQAGTTIVRIAIAPPNSVEQVTMAESSGSASLDTAAMRAAAGTVCTRLEQPLSFLQPFEFDASKQ